MPCLTCDHTMNKVVDYVFYCPRCGTMSVQQAGNSHPSTYVPQLVGRCRNFAKTLGPSWNDLWMRLGIAENINTPAERG